MRQATAVKIVGLLRKEWGAGFTIREISRRLDIGYRPAYMHIAALQKEGIITIITVGRAKQCFLNLESPKCRHLLQEVDLQRKEAIYKSSPKVKAILETAAAKLTEKFTADIHTIVLWGSYAKETATKTSDIDILFIVSNLKQKALREAIEQECASFYYSYNITVSPIITDIVEFKKMLKAKEMNVGKEVRGHGVALYGSEQFWRLIAWQG